MGRMGRRAVLAALATATAGGLAAASSTGRPTTADRLPRTGQLDPRYEDAESVLVAELVERHVPAAALAVAERGSVVVDRVYGWADPHRETPTEPDALFRIASLSKPLTRAAIRQLVRRGAIDYDAAAVDLLAIDSPADADPRLEQISVRHLLEHRGGWNRSISGDPLFQARTVADALGLERAPTRREFVRYAFGEPLDFAPGERRAYSNLGYAVLGTIVEDVTGLGYQEFLRSTVLEPSGATDVRLARSLPQDRPDREVWYAGGGVCRNAVDPTDPWPVRCPDGGFAVEAMDAHGGHVATARDYLAFATTFWLSGAPAERATFRSDSMRGHLPGSFAIALQPSPSIAAVVLCNRRAAGEGRLTSDLIQALLAA